MHVAGNVFPDNPLALPVCIGMNVVENVFKLPLPTHSAMNTGIIAFSTIMEGVPL
jgi:hypothetical protein